MSSNNTFNSFSTDSRTFGTKDFLESNSLVAKLAFLLLVILSFTICKGGTIDPSVPDEKYKNYGSKFKCVLKIIGTCNCEEKHTFNASAVAISPNWALTAAHVVKNSTKKSIY